MEPAPFITQSEEGAETSHEEREGFPEEPEDLSELTAIQNRYTFWYRCDLGEKGKVAKHNYSDSIKKIASFQSVERFWAVYDYLKRPSEFKNAEFHLFKDGIRPFWEDVQNKAGGKWSLRLPKGVASRYWEEILMAIVGEQFDVGYEICGAVMSVRSNEDIISVWNKTADNKEAVDKIRDQIRKFVRLPPAIPIEYKRHQVSLEEGSSYKNPNMIWRPPVKATNTGGHHGYHPNNAINHPNGSSNSENKHYEHSVNKPHYRSNTYTSNYHTNSAPAGATSNTEPNQLKPAWKTTNNRRGDGSELVQAGLPAPAVGAPATAGWRRGAHVNRPSMPADVSVSEPSAVSPPPPSAAPAVVPSKPFVNAAAAAPAVGNSWTRVKNPFNKDEPAVL